MLFFLYEVFKPPKHASQLCLDNSVSEPVARYTQAVKKEKERIWMSVFYEKGEMGNSNADARGFPFSYYQEKHAENLLGVNHQQVMSVCDVCTGFPVRRGVISDECQTCLYCSRSPLASLCCFVFVFLSPFPFSLHHHYHAPSHPPSPVLWRWSRVARLIPAYRSSSPDHQPLCC